MCYPGGSGKSVNGVPGTVPDFLFRQFLMNVSAIYNISTPETSILTKCLSYFACFRFLHASPPTATCDFDAQARGF